MPRNHSNIWTRTAAGREHARQMGLAAQRLRPHLPKCTAKAKSTGEQCRNLALENGKCHLHGGKTPKGDNWHRRQWPSNRRTDALARADAKIKKSTHDAEMRRQRVDAMTLDERAAHEKWQRTHKPGKAADRARARKERNDAAQFREFARQIREDQAVADERQVLPPVSPTEMEEANMSSRRHESDDEDPAGVRDEMLDLVSTRGIRAAITAAIAVCEDENAPAPARATASGLLLRAAGLGGFGKNFEPDKREPGAPRSLEEIDRDLKLAEIEEEKWRRRAAAKPGLFD